MSGGKSSFWLNVLRFAQWVLLVSVQPTTEQVINEYLDMNQ